MVKRLLTLLTLLLGLSLSAFAQVQSKPPVPGYVFVDNQKGCQIFTNNKVDKTIKWSGQCKNGFAEGKGIAEYFLRGVLNDTAEGNFVSGKQHGQGTHTFVNGDKYVGQFRDNKEHGQGTYTYVDGGKYVGQVKNGNWHGQGAFTFRDGSKYVGEWKYFNRHGRGIQTYASGIPADEGIWADNKFVRAERVNLPPVNQQTDVALNEERRKLDADRQSQSKLPPCPEPDYSKKTDGERFAKWTNCYGRYVSLNDASKGDVYVGEFRNGSFYGKGTYTFANGDTHIGQYKDGDMNGQGSTTFADGHMYVGEFKDGKYNGQGTLTIANGDKYVGKFKDNAFHGKGTYTRADGNKYEGDFKDGKQHGQGTLTIANGDKYVGELKDGKANGQGTYTYANGDKYVGEFKDNKMHGEGIETYADGRSAKKGIWANDNFIRAEKITPSPLIQQTDVAINEERRKLDADRQALELERQRLTEERNRREQAKQSSRLSLQTTTTNPDANGVVIISVRTNADTSSLKVNGEEQGGRLDGNYVIKKVARVGQDTQFTIVATDVNGNTDTTTITVARQALSQSSNQSASLKPENIKRAATRDAVAIIIGIQNYKRVPKADFANNDAKEFYEYAIRGLGIKPENIKLLVDEDADEVNIVKAFENWLPLQVNKNKTDVYVFYSGHGLPSSDGKSLYFLPYGVDKELLSRTAVGQAEVVSALVASKPKSVTMFIDACYSGQTRSGEMMIASVRPLAVKSDASVYPPNFTVISASSNDQYSSSSPELKHGIFSFYLMKGMEGDADGNKDGKITAGEMQEYLSDKVSRQAMSMSRKQDTQLVGDANRVLIVR